MVSGEPEAASRDRDPEADHFSPLKRTQTTPQMAHALQMMFDPWRQPDIRRGRTSVNGPSPKVRQNQLPLVRQQGMWWD